MVAMRSAGGAVVPLTPAQKARYPRDWPQVRARILARAGNVCECTGQCGDHAREVCRAPNSDWICRLRDDPARWVHLRHFDARNHRASVRVVLTIAHYPDRAPENCDDSNLLALCQRCHLMLDREQHLESRRTTRATTNRQQTLFRGDR